MKFWPFGKNLEEPPNNNEDNELVCGNSDDLVVVSNGKLDIGFYEHRSFGGDVIGGTAFIDAMIPAAGAAVDAAGQFGHAVVRFPEGAKWADLINRKTPGWEGFKQLGILKDGKFQPQAAIKQAKLQPAAIGNLALQGAAMVVGQMYMVEINKQLEEVATGIAAIQEEMRLERESNIEACMELLKEYSEDYMTISDDAIERQAVRNQIEAIRKEAKETWLFQMKRLQSLERSLCRSGKLKDDQLEAKIHEFVQRDKAAHDAFIFLIAAEQVKMQYSQSYAESQIAKERESILDRVNGYTELRENVQHLLIDKIDKLGGAILAFPDVKDAQGLAPNPVIRLGQTIERQAPRVFFPNMREEARRQKEGRKSNYAGYVKRDNPINGVASARIENLDGLDFIYNQADTLLIDENGIHYLREDDQSEQEEGE